MPVLANTAAARVLSAEGDVPEEADGVARRPADGTRPAEDERAYLSVAAAASLLGLSQKTIQRAVKGVARPLPHIRIGRRVLIARADLDRWVAAQRVIPTVAAGVSGDVTGLLQRLHAPPGRRHRRR